MSGEWTLAPSRSAFDTSSCRNDECPVYAVRRKIGIVRDQVGRVDLEIFTLTFRSSVAATPQQFGLRAQHADFPGPISFTLQVSNLGPAASFSLVLGGGECSFCAGRSEPEGLPFPIFISVFCTVTLPESPHRRIYLPICCQNGVPPILLTSGHERFHLFDGISS